MAPDTKRARRAAETRAKVFAAARELFAQHGYEAVTMRQVAAAADASTGAIFAHVKDKEDLFEQATGRKVPMALVKDSLRQAVLLGVKAVFEPAAAAQLLRDLYGLDSVA